MEKDNEINKIKDESNRIIMEKDNEIVEKNNEIEKKDNEIEKKDNEIKTWEKDSFNRKLLSQKLNIQIDEFKLKFLNEKQQEIEELQQLLIGNNLKKKSSKIIP
jgi:hypothetical protein